VGTSSCGQIAGPIASAHPGRVRSTAFVGSPVGVEGPRETAFRSGLDEGRRSMAVASRGDLKAQAERLLVEKSFVPPPIEILRVGHEIARPDGSRMSREAVRRSDDRPLQALAPGMERPGPIVRCRQEEVFHPGGIDVLADALPAEKLVGLRGRGHMRMLGRPVAPGRALPGPEAVGRRSILAGRTIRLAEIAQGRAGRREDARHGARRGEARPHAAGRAAPSGRGALPGLRPGAHPPRARPALGFGRHRRDRATLDGEGAGRGPLRPAEPGPPRGTRRRSLRH
jgi:hypothetical protein